MNNIQPTLRTPAENLVLPVAVLEAEIILPLFCLFPHLTVAEVRFSSEFVNYKLYSFRTACLARVYLTVDLFADSSRPFAGNICQFWRIPKVNPLIL